MYVYESSLGNDMAASRPDCIYTVDVSMIYTDRQQ